MSRLQKVGLHLPKEQTWGKILQAAQAAGLQVEDEAASVAIKRRLKHSHQKRPVLVPQDLPWFKEAYGDELPHNLDEATVMTKSVKLRKSKGGASASSSAYTAPQGANVPPQAMGWEPLAMMMANMMNFQSAGFQNAQNAVLQWNKKRKMLEDGQPAADPHQPEKPKPLTEAPAIMDRTRQTEPAASVKPEASPVQQQEAAQDQPSQVAEQKKSEAALLELPKPSTTAPPIPKAGAPSGKSKPKAKAKAKVKSGAKPKGKAAAKAKAGSLHLKWPGTKAQEPIHARGHIIYVCPQSSNYRLRKSGERNDKAFSWKAVDPHVAWKRLVTHLSEQD